MSNNEPVVWSLADIVESLEETQTSGRYFVQIPKFQRSIVWTDSQIKRLVDSIYKGYPIGSLLAYQTDEARGNKIVLQLVDGLQRVTAISRYLAAPLKYAPIEEMVGKEFLEACSECIFSNTSALNLGIVSQRIRSWFDTVTELTYGPSFSFNRLATQLANDDSEALHALIQMNLTTSAGDQLLGRVLEDVSKARDYKVPVNIYSGPIENVPIIFERINSQGAQLSKYEILAASWSHTSVEVKNPAVIQAISDKYQVMIANGYEIEGFDEGTADSNEYNLYEYLFGLGKVLAKNFPTLFHASDSPDENSPVAFQIFTVAFRLPVAKMGSLAEKLPRLSNGRLNLSKVESAVLEACGAAEKALRQFLKLRLNEQVTGPSGISQNQAISYITSYLATCFDEEFETCDARLAAVLQANLPAHFLLDLLRGAWSGSGDSTLFERTWEAVLDSSGKRIAYTPAPHYTRAVEAQSLRTAFEVWHDSQLEARQKERARYSKEIKPVLKFIYSSLVTSQEDLGVEFELEHVYPVAFLKQMIADGNLEGLPMAAVGNLMLLPKSINRIKRENLLGDHVLGSAREISQHEIDQLQRFLISPDLAEVSKASAVDPDAFRSFCQSRAESMINHLVGVLKLK